MARKKGTRSDHVAALRPPKGARKSWGADFTPWGGGRWTLRDPDHPEWTPTARSEGNTTKSEREATVWARFYVEQLTLNGVAEHSPNVRPIRIRLQEYYDMRKGLLASDGDLGPSGDHNTLQRMRVVFSRVELALGADSPTYKFDCQKVADDMLRTMSVKTARSCFSSIIAGFLKWARVTSTQVAWPVQRKPNTRRDRQQMKASHAGFATPEVVAMRRESLALGERWLLAFDLMTFGGLRPSEAFGIDWEDFDEERRVLHVMRKSDGTLPKHGVVRESPLLPEWTHTSDGRTGRIVGDVGWRGPESSCAIIAWRTTLTEAGVRSRGRHQCRHTYARLVLERTRDILCLQEALGHATVGITEAAYRWVLPDEQADFTAKLLVKNPHNRPHIPPLIRLA